MSDTLTLADLQTIAHTTFGLTERQWQKAQFAFWDITGKHRAATRYISDECLNEVYDEIAKDLIDETSEDSIVDRILQVVLFLCKIHYGSAVDLDSCRNRMSDRLRHWKGRLGRMRIRAQEEAENKALEITSMVESRPPHDSVPPAITPAAESGFRNRAAWLSLHLRQRGWDWNSLYDLGGPDRKTVKKILDGKYVRAEVIPRLVNALNHKKIDAVTIKPEDVPND